MAIRRGWICLAFQLLMAIVADARTIQDLPDGHVRNDLCTPVNISVVLTSWQPVCITLHWACGHRMPNGEWFYVNLSSLEELNKEKERTVSPDELSAFRITYRAYNTRYKFIQEVPPYVNRTNIDNLQPNQKYTLTISSLSFNNPEGVSSKEVDFVSPAVVVSQPHPNDRFYNSFSSLRLDTDMNSINMKPGEVFVVICVLCVWLYIIFHFIKKWGKIRSLEPNAHRSTVRTGKSIVETDSMNGAQSVTKSRLQSFANVTTIPKLHMSESHNSLYEDDHQSLLGANNCMHHLSVLSPRLRQNSVFLTSPTRRGSFFPDESRLPRRYKSAEDLQSLVLEITNVQRQQRKLSQFSIKESDHLENCTLISEAERALLASGAHATAAYSAVNQHSGSTTRGSISAASRGSNGTLKLTDIAAVALAASNSQLSRIASPSKSSSSRELIAGAGSSSGTASTSGSKQSQGKLPRHKNSIVPIQVVDSSDSNHSTQATIASCERDLESSSGTTNCIYCRRRMSSSCDECTHCNGLNMGSIANRNMVLMQSKSFVNHTCSTENSQNSSFENPCTTSVSNLNVATSLTSSPASQPQPFRSSQPCLFQISEATDDIKHIDED